MAIMAPLLNLKVLLELAAAPPSVPLIDAGEEGAVRTPPPFVASTA